MKEETFKKLGKEYGLLKYRAMRTTALKLHYVYNKVDINIYVDFYDPELPVLQLLFVLKRENEKTIYYLQSVNIKENGQHKTYLDNLNYEVLKNLLDDEDTLVTFYEDMDKRLFESTLISINVINDTFLVNTSKYQKNANDIYLFAFFKKRKYVSRTYKRFKY